MSIALGERLRSLRKARGLSQEDVARRTGIGLKAYGDLERGRTSDPHYSTLEGAAHALGITVAELVGEVEPVPLDEPPAEMGRYDVRGTPSVDLPRVGREELLAQGIPVTDHEVDELNYTIAELWRLVRGGKPVAHFPHTDVDYACVWLLLHLVLDTPSIVTPEAAGVVREGMREKLRT